MTDRSNFIKNATFGCPDYIPINVAISQPLFSQYGRDLVNLLCRYPEFFPDKEWLQTRLNANAKQQPDSIVDNWGCTWDFALEGLEGIVTGHPLADWADLDSYPFPNFSQTDGKGTIDIDLTLAHIREAKRRGHLAEAGLPHGYFLLRLEYLRGYENLMMDIGTEDEHLSVFVDRLTQYWFEVIKLLAGGSPDLISLPEDLGTQDRLLISPKSFRKYIYPAYSLYVDYCRQRGILTHIHSDGFIMEIADDFLKLGVSIINPQDLCNGIDNIAKAFKGRVCIDLDIDRQQVIPFGSRKDIMDLIEEEVRKLGSPQGGLSMIVGIYPGTPLPNIEALLDAFRKYRFYWSDKA